MRILLLYDKYVIIWLPSFILHYVRHKREKIPFHFWLWIVLCKNQDCYWSAAILYFLHLKKLDLEWRENVIFSHYKSSKIWAMTWITLRISTLYQRNFQTITALNLRSCSLIIIFIKGHLLIEKEEWNWFDSLNMHFITKRVFRIQDCIIVYLVLEKVRVTYNNCIAAVMLLLVLLWVDT